jgi:hypothetical protein
MKFSDIFFQEYYRKMLQPKGNNPIRNRADSFLKVFQLLESKKQS